MDNTKELNFMEEMEKMLGRNQFSITENGAIGYKTSGKNLVDINFKVSSFRNSDEDTIINCFKKAYNEDRILAIKWLFYARDVREGLGERRTFRIILKWLAAREPEIFNKLVPLVGEYGRYDDLWELFSVSEEIKKIVVDFICEQLTEDMKNYNSKKPITLLAKWLPSENASSKDTKEKAKIIRQALGLSSKLYRKTLSALRKYLDITECKMSNNRWNEIDYEKVPSRANLIYNHAFFKHDSERREEYLNRLKNGEAKINSSVLFPHDIVSKYNRGWRYSCPCDPTLEAMWNSLPDLINGKGETLVVADGSGSMYFRVGNTSVETIDVANALAIYFSEHNSGKFKNKYITFSENPRFVDFSDCITLKSKLERASEYDECANTNIEAVFDLILKTAVVTKAKQSDIPKNILIISDMEFDEASNCSFYGTPYYSKPDKALFKSIEEKFNACGYKMPRLIFWNVCSRTGTIPVQENELGVALVSGFSINICKMVLSDKLDPYECICEVLNSNRYKAIEDALK